MGKTFFKKINRKLRRGMTLIEIAVVVMILGSIMLLVTSNIDFGGISEDTEALRLRKDATELPAHMERYATKYGKYPSEEQGLAALVEKPTSGDVPEDWRPVLNKKNAINDPWGTPYILKKDPNGDDFMIITLGKDKKEGGEGKNTDFNIRDEESYPQAFRKGKK